MDYVEPSTLKSSIGSANYSGDTRPYTEVQYETSTSGRPVKEYAPGDNWTNHPKTMEYLSNTTASPLNCTDYSVNSAGSLVNNGTYAAGQLTVTKTADEDGKATYTFTDKQGRTLLERAVNGSEYLDTYYVYDSYGNLRFVLQPMYQTTADLNLYAFQYKYDILKRCTWKKLPGVSGVTMEYDSSDRMVFSQDGVQSTAGKWTYYVYDDLGRLTRQGENGSKTVGTAPYLQNFYDDYTDFIAVAGSGFSDDDSGNSRGYLTGSAQTVLGTSTKIYTAYYYNNLGQVVKEVKSNLLGGHDVTETTYTFSGKPATVKHTHNGSLEETYTYTYDGKDRLTKVTHKLGSTTVTLAEYTYDALGRQSTRKLHGSSTNTLTYSYNIQNWLTGISGTKFTQALGYGSDYNGNISSMSWTANGTSHAYTFTYDGVNRMLGATHGAGNFTEKVTGYDKNGNIKGLQRYGQTGASTYGLVDNLTYTLNGNQITRVDDAVTTAAYGTNTAFTNGASAANEYTYDNNGNLTKDSNKNISGIAYNCLNLPGTVTFSDGSTIVYSYAADGTKLRTVHTIGGTATQTDYCNNVVYENGVQKYLLTGEGYVDLSTSTYYYYLKDHQGNNRVVINGSGTVAETNHYYPFGGVFAGTSVQPYKYNGKELDTKKGLNWYDYGARHYDATLGRWHSVDPLAEKYFAWSPYNYCLNNPNSNIDPDGRSVWTKLLKGASKVGRKVSQKGISSLMDKSTYVEAFADVIEDAETVFDEDASIRDRVVAGFSLASELLPVSFNDTKDVSRLLGFHGNSKMSGKAQHAYDIIEKETGKRVKTGVSGGKVRKDGKSYRAEQQVRKWNKETGYENYESEIIHFEPAGEGARDKILKYEKARAKILEDELDNKRHKRP